MKQEEMKQGAASSAQKEDSWEAAATTRSSGRVSTHRSFSAQDPLLEDHQEVLARADSFSHSRAVSTGGQAKLTTLLKPEVSESSEKIASADQAPTAAPSSSVDSGISHVVGNIPSAASRPIGFSDSVAAHQPSPDIGDHASQELPLSSVSVPQSPLSHCSIDADIPCSVAAQYGSAVSPVSQRLLRKHDKEQRVGVSCILCLAACALATAVAVALAVLRSRDRDFTESCPGFDCQLAVRYMRSLTDAKVAPCKDFYSHVCRKWDSRGDGLSFLDMAVQDLDTSLNWTLLSIGTGRELYYGANELLSFYRCCHGFAVRVSKYGSEGSVPVLLELFANDSSLLLHEDTQALLAHVIRLSLTRGLFTVFKVMFVRHRDIFSIYISSGKTLAEKLGETSETRLLNSYFRQLFKVTRTLLGNATSPNEEETIGAFEVFEKQMKQLKERHAAGILEEGSSSLLNSIEDHLGSSGWLEAISDAYGGKVPLTPSSFVLSECFVCVTNTMRLLATKKKYAPAYVFAHVLNEVAQFFYKKDDRGVPRPSNNPTACLRASYEVMPPSLWSNLYSNFSRSAAAADSRTEDMFERITNLASYSIATENLTSEMNSAVSITQSFLTVSRSQLFLYNGSLKLATPSTERLFKGIDEDDWGNFPALYLKAKALEAARRLEDLVSSNQIVETSLLLKGYVAYHPMKNAVVFPPAVRRLPVTYPESVPVEYDLGTTGILIATELFRAGLESLSIDDSSWAKWYHKKLRNLQDCFDDAIVIPAKFSQKKITSESAFELYVFKRALRVVLSVLKDYYSAKSGRDVSAEVRWVSAQRTFFKRFCLLSCSGGGPGSSFKRKLRCLLLVLSTSEFREVFGCKKPQRKKINSTCSNL